MNTIEYADKTPEGYFKWQVRDDGRVWHYQTDCFGHPPGTCTEKHTPATEPYCPRCFKAYMNEIHLALIADRVTSLEQAAYSAGVLPVSFRDWKPRELYHWQKTAIEYIDEKKQHCAWIQDPPGTGKTEILFHIIYRALRRGLRCAFGTGQEITSSQKDVARRTAFITYDLLAIDDIDRFAFTPYSCAELHYILDARNQRRKRTIVTCERKGSEVARDLAEHSHFGRSTIERLSWPKRQCLSIELRGQNLRRNDAPEPVQGEMI